MDNRHSEGRIDYIVHIRVIATFMVVLFHCYAPYFYDVNVTIEGCPFIPFYKNVFIIEERIQMPLFFFLSGYLFQYLYNRGHYAGFRILFIKKLKRLVVPYFIFGGGIYLLCPKEVSNTINLSDKILHLWFILSLFWCFILQYVLCKIINNKFCHIILGLIMELVMRQIPSVLCINALFCYFIYFTVAYNVTNSDYFLKKNIVPCISFVLFVIGATLCVQYEGRWLENTFYKILHHAIYLISSFAAIVFIFSIFIKCNHGIGFFERLIDKNSYGIYIFHYWIMINLISTALIQNIMVNHIFLYPIGMFFLLVSLSCFVTYVLRKTPIFKEIL